MNPEPAEIPSQNPQPDTRNALEISQPITLNLQKVPKIAFLKFSQIIGRYQGKYLMRMKYYQDCKCFNLFYLVNLQGEIKRKFFSSGQSETYMPRFDTLLAMNGFVEKGFFNVQLFQWRLSTGEILFKEIVKPKRVRPSAGVITFKQSSLICVWSRRFLSGYYESDEQYVLQIDLDYYKFPLTDQNCEKPFHSYLFKYKSPNDTVFRVQKLNDRSKIALIKQKHNYVRFRTYSIEEGQKNYDLSSCVDMMHPVIFRAYQVQPNRIFVHMKSDDIYYRLNIEMDQQCQKHKCYKIKILSPPQTNFTKIQFTNNFKPLQQLHLQLLKKPNQHLTHEFIDPTTSEPMGMLSQNPMQKQWQVTVPDYDGNLEIWQSWNQRTREVEIKEVRLGQLRFQRGVVFGFMLVRLWGLKEDIDDDLVFYALEMLVEKYQQKNNAQV